MRRIISATHNAAFIASLERSIGQLDDVYTRARLGLIGLDGAITDSPSGVFVLRQQGGRFRTQMGGLVLSADYTKRIDDDPQNAIINPYPQVTYGLMQRGKVIFDVHSRRPGVWIAAMLPEPLSVTEAADRKWTTAASDLGYVTIICEGRVVDGTMTNEKAELLRQSANAAQVTAIQHGVATNLIEYSQYRKH